MKKTILFVSAFLISFALLSQSKLSDSFENASKLNVSEKSKYELFELSESFSSDIGLPKCTRNELVYSSFFKFTVPENGLATVTVKFPDEKNFGLSLYTFKDGEYKEINCNWSYVDEISTPILERDQLASQEVLARIWHIEKTRTGKVEIGISPDINPDFQTRSALIVEVGTYTPQELVEEILMSGCVQANNIQYTGHPDAIGYFYSGMPGLDFEEGIILSSGLAVDAMGPNTGNASTNLSYPGDPDLQSIVNANTNDAAILEFEFIPATDEVEFNYVFASDEYPQWANSSFNDVFAFFVSGGPENYNMQNIALLPGTSTPVSINNVNYGSSHNGPCVNCEYYIVNDGSPYIMYDGMTVTLTAYAAVTACEAYQMKLGVADVVDGILDSAVFLEAGSFFSGAAVDADNISDVGEDFDIWEGCSNTYLISLVEGADNTEDIIIDVSIDHENSTAVEGVDFSTFPTQLVIPAGESEVSFDYEAFNIEDGDIFFIVTFETGCPCPGTPGGDPIVDTIWIYDFAFVKGGIQDLQTKYCGEEAPESLVLEGRTNLDPEIFYHWSTGEEGMTTTIYPEFGVSTYYLTMSDVCGNELFDEVTIVISDLTVEEMTENFPSCTDACDGVFEIEVEGEFTPITYRYANEMWVYWPDSVYTTSNNTFVNLCPANYRLTVTDAVGCDHRLTFNIPNPPPIVLAQGLNESDMVFCDDPGEVTLSAQSNQPTPIFEWSTGDTESETTFTPETGVEEYWVKVYDGCGNYIQNYVNISYSQIQVNVDTEPDTGDCDGSATALAFDGIHPYLYYWESPIMSYNWEQTGLCTGYYTLVVTDNKGCQKTVEIFIDEDISFVSESLYGDVFTVYPNPTQGEFTILYDMPITENLFVNITDVQGRIVQKVNVTSSETAISEFVPGVYFVQFYDNDKIIGVERVVITK